MEGRFNPRNNDAWTLIELFVVLAVLAILAALINWGPLPGQKAKARRIHCVNNLMQISMSFMVWDRDHQGRFPMAVESNHGGTIEWVDGGNAFRHFQAISNELFSTKILVCPSDNRIPAMNFQALKNENISYFVGLDATDAKPPMLLTGDRNITNGLTPQRTVLMLPLDRPAGWTGAMHVRQGNVGLADGSVQSFTTLALHEALKNTGDSTNRIAIPE